MNKEGEVTAGDIQEVQGYEVLNPKQVICTLDKKHKFDAELEVRVGRGFATGDENKRPDQPIGVIPIDSIFSPVTRVKYAVENTRVGQRTDYDKLILEVWTDGRLTPDDALLQASAILRHHLDVFVDFNEDVIEFDETPAGVSEENMKLKKLLNMSVNEIELSVRAANCLNNANITTVGQLAQKTESEMLKYRNFGKKSLNEIKDKLQQLGLGLGMKFESGLVDIPLRCAAAEPPVETARRRADIIAHYQLDSRTAYETSKENGQARPQGRASQSAARQSGLQPDRASAHQNHAGQSQSRPPARGENGHARQEWIAPRAPHGVCDVAPEGCGEEIVRRNRAALRRAQWRLHPHHQARPAQERFRSDGVPRMGRCRTVVIEEKPAEEKKAKKKEPKAESRNEPKPRLTNEEKADEEETQARHRPKSRRRKSGGGLDRKKKRSRIRNLAIRPKATRPVVSIDSNCWIWTLTESARSCQFILPSAISSQATLGASRGSVV